MWTMLGARPVTTLAWESFGEGWVTDAVKQLKLDPTVIRRRLRRAARSGRGRSDSDVVFTWNGTTSGVRVPDGDWIPDDREGLLIADATRRVFAHDLPWDKIDVVTFSWQKVLGGEGAHGVLILGPRAVERLESYTPAWPLPKIFRLDRQGQADRRHLQGRDDQHAVDAGGRGCDLRARMGEVARRPRGPDRARRRQCRSARQDRARSATGSIISPPIRRSRSNTSVCLKFAGDAVTGLDDEALTAIERRWRRCSKPRTRPTTRRLSRRPAGPAHLVRRDRRHRRHRGARPLARLGLRHRPAPDLTSPRP